MTNMKMNLEVTRNETENPNVIRVTETYEFPRYTASIVCADWECEWVVNEITEDCKIWTPCRDYQSLHNFDLDEDDLTGDLQEDLEMFESKVKEEYPDVEVECYVLGAYVHSGTSFSISKGGDHRCAFDSGQLGFIAVPKNYYMSPDRIAEQLTAAWNGEFMEYQVYDELREEIVDSITTADYSEAKEWTEKFEKRYGVDFSECKVQY